MKNIMMVCMVATGLNYSSIGHGGVWGKLGEFLTRAVSEVKVWDDITTKVKTVKETGDELAALSAEIASKLKTLDGSVEAADVTASANSFAYSLKKADDALEAAPNPAPMMAEEARYNTYVNGLLANIPTKADLDEAAQLLDTGSFKVDTDDVARLIYLRVLSVAYEKFPKSK